MAEAIRLTRAERRHIIRENNKKEAWRKHPSPKELGVGSGWFGQIDRCFENGKYCVLIRTVQTPWGKVEHAAIRNTANTDIPWREKQRIKNDLFGMERVAVEVFPAESELVDEANMYHLWVLEEGFRIPFGIYERGVADEGN